MKSRPRGKNLLVGFKELVAKRASYLAQQTEQLETAIVDLELRRAGEAAHAVCERVEKVEQVLRHDGGGSNSGCCCLQEDQDQRRADGNR